LKSISELASLSIDADLIPASVRQKHFQLVREQYKDLKPPISAIQDEASSSNSFGRKTSFEMKKRVVQPDSFQPPKIAFAAEEEYDEEDNDEEEVFEEVDVPAEFQKSESLECNDCVYEKIDDVYVIMGGTLEKLLENLTDLEFQGNSLINT
jgi:hypothetical protein